MRMLTDADRMSLKRAIERLSFACRMIIAPSFVVWNGYVPNFMILNQSSIRRFARRRGSADRRCRYRLGLRRAVGLVHPLGRRAESGHGLLELRGCNFCQKP
jgi:hypothetical protein